MEIYIIMYIIGFILTYIAFRWIGINDSIMYSVIEGRSWGDVFICFIMALFSWIGLIVALVVFMAMYKPKTKPPKWL